MAADPKARRIALLMMGKPGGPSGDDDEMPDDDEGAGDLEDAMSGLRDAMRSGDDAEAAAAFRAAVQAVEHG